MYNLLPGSGLGFGASSSLAFGLIATTTTIVEVPSVRLKGSAAKGDYNVLIPIRVEDNPYVKTDDRDIMEILTILFEVIE